MILKPLVAEEAYGPAAAQALRGLAKAAEPVIHRFVADFYASLHQTAQTAQVLNRLTAEEFTHLRQQQAGHLLMLLDPDLNAAKHRERALAVGRIHAQVGVELPWLIEAYNLYQQALHHLFPSTDAGKQRVTQRILDRRLLLDLESQGTGYRLLADELAKILVEIQQSIHTSISAIDLYRAVVDGLCKVDGVVAAFIGREGKQNHLEIEIFKGNRAQPYLDAMHDGVIPRLNLNESAAEGERGPTWRAWHSGQIQVVDSYAHDQSLSAWAATGAAMGLRSLAVIPLTDEAGQTFAAVNVYSKWPGFFNAPERRIFLECLQQPLSLAAQRQAQGRVIDHHQRKRFTDLLKAGHVLMLYQPIIDLKAGRLVKVEALARLIDRGRSLVSPGRFLPSFGSDELYRLFETGVKQVCTAQQAWQSVGLNVTVSLNLPPQGVGDARYHDALFSTIEQCGADPAHFEIEILESHDIQDTNIRDRFFQNLRLCGIRIIQDDLGSGHSSLLRLESMPFDGVKIDQGLVLRAAQKEPQRALEFIYYLTHLAHALKVPVTIEGLENPGLIEAATILGADYGQGFGIARPLPADTIPEWTKKFHLAVDITQPKTPLGALAGYLLWDRQLSSLNHWPSLIEDFVGAPCMVQRFIETTRPADPVLQDLLGKNHALALLCMSSRIYQRTRQELISKLSAMSQQQNQE